MKALIVAAGAVGQVYARHLQLGGAEVAFLVKPKHAAAARSGFDMYPLNRANPRRGPVRLEGFRVLESSEDVAREPWDCVLLCMASPALREGTWLGEVARATGDATFIMLQPGSEDRTVILQHVLQGRLVQGLIGFVSYHAPLPGESVPRPGVAYWLPPLAPSTSFGGTAERVGPLVATLLRGGLRARLDPDVAGSLAFAGALLQMHIVALECAGWSFAALRHDRDLLRLASSAAREGMAVGAARLDVRAPLLPRLVRPVMVRLLTRLAPCLVPFDLETYLRVHFTKVGEQTHRELAAQARLAKEVGVPAPAVRELAERLARAAA